MTCYCLRFLIRVSFIAFLSTKCWEALYFDKIIAKFINGGINCLMRRQESLISKPRNSLTQGRFVVYNVTIGC